MKEFDATTRLEVSAEVYWELRQDGGFDDFCAVAEGVGDRVRPKHDEASRDDDNRLDAERNAAKAREAGEGS